jgi:hypothetical protein
MFKFSRHNTAEANGGVAGGFPLLISIQITTRKYVLKLKGNMRKKGKEERITESKRTVKQPLVCVVTLCDVTGHAVPLSLKAFDAFPFFN